MISKSLKQFLNQQNGLTLVEMIVSVLLLSILLAMATGGLTHYLAGKALETSARELTSEIRQAQAKAVATGNIYRLNFSGSNTYTLEWNNGSSWVITGGTLSLESGVVFSPAPSFGSDNHSYIVLYPRGTSESGNLRLTGRYGKTKTLTVEGDTVNVVVSQ